MTHEVGCARVICSWLGFFTPWVYRKGVVQVQYDLDCALLMLVAPAFVFVALV